MDGTLIDNATVIKFSDGSMVNASDYNFENVTGLPCLLFTAESGQLKDEECSGFKCGQICDCVEYGAEYDAI